MRIQHNNIMLDLETMGNGANSAITAIGAVRFNQSGLSDEFYTLVDLESCVQNGMEIDPSTVVWWLQQSDEARAQFEQPNLHIACALSAFSAWVGPAAVVWGNGAAFDNALLSNAYRKLNLQQPWQFWNDACYRTIKNMYPGIRLRRIGTHHNALDDAKSQAQHLIEIWSN